MHPTSVEGVIEGTVVPSINWFLIIKVNVALHSDVSIFTSVSCFYSASFWKESLFFYIHFPVGVILHF